MTQGSLFTDPNCGACEFAGSTRVIPKLRRAEILGIGEAPGAEEEEQGMPFVGPSGRMIRAALEGLDVVYANVLQCRPPNNRTPTKDEIKACSPLLDQYIGVVQPRIVLAIGATAMKALTGKAGILKLAGKLLTLHGVEGGLTVMPIIHPSWVLHGGDPRAFDDCIKSLRAHLFPADVKWRVLLNGNQIKAVPWGPGPLGFDWETDRLRPPGNFLSFALSDGKQNVVIYGSPDEETWEFLRTHQLIAHCATFEHEWAKSKDHNIYITHDTQVLAHLDDERLSTKLDSIAVRLGVPIISYVDNDLTKYPPKKLAERNAIHAQSTRHIYDILYPKIRTEKLLYNSVLVPSTETMSDLHLNGVAYDEGRRLAALKKIAKDAEEPTAILKEVGLLNIKSTPQRVKLLYDVLKLPKVYKTDGGAWSTDADVLRYFTQRYKKDEKRSRILKALLDLTTMQGWRTQFLEAFPKYDTGDRILRGRYHVTGTVNGRLSTSEPNMQNMPREGPVRGCLVSRFGPRHGRIWTADYKQIELMVFAAIAKDRRLINAFNEEADIHRITASIIHKKPEDDITPEERFTGKRVNFALATGVGPYKLAFMLGITDQEAKEYMELYFDGYPGLAAYIRKFQYHSPPVLVSPTGRRRNLDITDVRRARNQALNFIPAEVALTVHLIAANSIAGFLRQSTMNSCLICLIHDSLSVDTLIEEEVEVSDRLWGAVELPNSHPLTKAIRDAGITFRVDMKAGYSLGDQEEIR